MRVAKEWTPEEVEDLWIYYPHSTAKEMREILPGRSNRSITHKARRIGLNKVKEALRRTGRESNRDSYVDEFPHITKEVLENLYITEKRSTREIAEILGCGRGLINKRLHKYEIPVRKHAGDPSFSPEERKMKWGRSGADHHNWKGGVTEVSNVIRNRVAHVSLEAFKRDGFACIECGGGEHNLHAHHIRPFSEIVAEIREENDLHDLTSWEAKDKLASICENDARLLDVGNLITLCPECHYEAHHGKRTA